MANLRNGFSFTGYTRKLVMTAMLAAVATVLILLNFPLPFMPSFVKFDFSELPALIASFSMGPQYGVLVCLIKNLINLITKFETFGVGELSNFLHGIALVLPAGLVYRFIGGRKGALIGSLIGSVLMALVCFPINYFITYPIYATAFIPGATVEEGIAAIISMYQAILPPVGELWQCLLIFNVPFTLMKGLVNALLTFLIYKHISHLIKGTPRKKKEAKPSPSAPSLPETDNEQNKM